MEHDEPIKILAPHTVITRRRAMSLGFGGMASLYLAACGGSSGSNPAAGASATPISSSAKVEAGPLLLANWPDYTDPRTYKDYTAAVGPKVKVEGFGSNDELVTKLSAGGADYDIVVPSGDYVPELAAKGLARKLDHSLIPNLKNLQPKFRQVPGDEGNKYSVTKDYGITTFYYRTDVVKNPPDTLLGWFQALPKYKGKNINFIEGSAETLPLVLISLGLDPQSTKDADYQKALDLLNAAKPAIKTINSTYIDRLSRGEIDLGLGWNGDIARGIDAAKKKGIEIKMFISPDKGWFWTDTWLIPAASKNPVAAHKWINFLLDPKIAGQEWNYVVYPVPVDGAKAHAKPSVANNPNTNIPESIIQTYSSGVRTPALSAIQGKYYTKFRS
jgi:spermidine/putrescine transport system substrate-binding protein